MKVEYIKTQAIDPETLRIEEMYPGVIRIKTYTEDPLTTMTNCFFVRISALKKALDKF